MREFIDLFEHHVETNSPANAAILDLISNAELVGDDHDTPIYFKDLNDNHEVYVMGDLDDPLAYAIFQHRQGNWWCTELKPLIMGAGYGAKLLYYVLINARPRLFMGLRMTEDAIRTIERMVASDKIKSALADPQTGKMVKYDPIADALKPLYDRVVTGINRQPLPTNEADKIVWVLSR